eukprot:358261-Chlamydomonas_euryale.AAC.3
MNRKGWVYTCELPWRSSHPRGKAQLQGCALMHAMGATSPAVQFTNTIHADVLWVLDLRLTAWAQVRPAAGISVSLTTRNGKAASTCLV